jgi:glucose/arabinose dehydrogenase
MPSQARPFTRRSSDGFPLRPLACLLGLIALAVPLPALAVPTLAPGFSMTTVISGMGDPLSFDWAPNGDLYIAEKSGKIRVWRNATLTLVGTIPVSINDELGITAIELDPDFATNHFLWMTYSTPLPLRQRVSRFTIVNDTLAGEVIVVEYPVTNWAHHAGCIRARRATWCSISSAATRPRPTPRSQRR